jgi:Leucine-rich repeat (LRR) protein
VPDDLSEETIKLVLTNNSFPELGSKHLRSLTRLKSVDLSKNRIETIGSRVLCTSEELEVLKLNDNNIEIEKNDTFYCLKKLRILSLKNNQISSIPQSLFQNNVNLVVLDLSYNHITFLEPHIFQQNLVLSYVVIEANPISSVSNFTALSKYLNVLDIDFCGQPSVISYQRYLTLETEQNMTQVKDLLAKDLTNGDRQSIFVVLKPKLDALGYNQLDYLYPNVTTRTVTTYSGAPVFCYCKLFSRWYWCIDKTSSCPGMKDAFRNQTCNLHKKRDIHKMMRTANKQADAKPILPILVLILVLSILVTF